MNMKAAQWCLLRLAVALVVAATAYGSLCHAAPAGEQWGDVVVRIKQLSAAGKSDEALTLARGAHRLTAEDKADPRFADAALMLGNLYSARGRLADVERVLWDAIPYAKKSCGPKSVQVGLMHGLLASALGQRHASRAAIPHLRDALDILGDKMPENHKALCGARVGLAAALQDQGQYDEAEAVAREAIAVFERHSDLAFFEILARTVLAQVLVENGSARAATDECWNAISLATRLKNRQDLVGMVLVTLGSAELKRGNVDEAVTHLEKVVQGTPDAKGLPLHSAEAAGVLGLALLEKGVELERAVALLKTAGSVFEARKGADHRQTVAYREGLARARDAAHPGGIAGLLRNATYLGYAAAGIAVIILVYYTRRRLQVRGLSRSTHPAGVEVPCPDCGAAVAESTKFCPACGRYVPR